MAVDKYNIAIVGTGNIIKAHINALKNIPSFNIAGIYGKDYTRTKSVASSFGIKAFKDYQEILDDQAVQIVDIITTSDLHAEYGIKAANNSKHLIIEKPLDASFEKASKLVNLCQEKGVLLGVIYQRRFDEHIVFLKELIHNGTLGKIISGKIVFRQKRTLEYYQSNYNKHKGVLINNGIHEIDLAIHLMEHAPLKSWGTIKKTRPELDAEDYAQITMEFKDSILFSIDLLTNVKKAIPTRIEIHGQKGSIIFEGNKIKFSSIDLQLNNILGQTNYLNLYMARKIKTSFKFATASHANVFNNYLEALQGKNTLAVDGTAGLKSLKTVHDIYNNQ